MTTVFACFRANSAAIEDIEVYILLSPVLQLLPPSFEFRFVTCPAVSVHALRTKFFISNSNVCRVLRVVVVGGPKKREAGVMREYSSDERNSS